MPYNNVIDRSDANALIPVQESQEILKVATEQSVVLRFLRRATMSSKTMRMPVLSTLPVAYWVNGDTGLKQTTEAQWQQKFITAEELAVIVPIPESVVDDASFDIWGEVRPLVAEAIGAALDAAVLFGVNRPASWPESIVELATLKGSNIVRGAVNGQDLAGDISDAMALVEADGFDVNGFIAKTGLRAAFRNLRDANGQFLFSPSMQAATPDLLWGLPLRYVKHAGAWVPAQAEMIVGDWQQAIIAIRQDINFKILDQAVISDAAGQVVLNLAQQDMVAMRVTFRAGYQVANPVTPLNPNEATRSPFAVLRPAGWRP